ncbi:uncharacterized protein LOC125533813 [Triticum urartu]|uniref:uncharacterized protein LOC125533813 n=1 Tax=Triticum urartu TaxID=4572 RepID=UPI002043665B|nr:uncharacterized protein LOC125533813 [Triticum urartu]
MLHSQATAPTREQCQRACSRRHALQRSSALRVAIMLAFAPPTKMSPCCPLLLLFPAMPTAGLSREALPVLLLMLAAAVVALAWPCGALQLQDAALIDDVIMEAAEECYNGKHRRTGVTYPLSLPASLSAVDGSVSRFRSGSLSRHGVRLFGEFSVPPGLVVPGRAAGAHLLAVRVNMGNLSAVYDEHAARGGGYRIASPVLGLMFYGLDPRDGTAPLQVRVTGAAIRVNFSMAVPALQPGAVPLCMAVWLNGSVAVTDVQAGTNTCHLRDQGHVALVLGGVGDGDAVAEDGEVSKWKLALFGAALGAGGTVLLGLVLVAMLSVQRRKSEMAEMERRAYEEEALRVAMVGHVRAPSACGSRTTPDELENEYRATL